MHVLLTHTSTTNPTVKCDKSVEFVSPKHAVTNVLNLSMALSPDPNAELSMVLAVQLTGTIDTALASQHTQPHTTLYVPLANPCKSQ
jgi:hypothetical protein